MSRATANRKHAVRLPAAYTSRAIMRRSGFLPVGRVTRYESKRSHVRVRDHCGGMCTRTTAVGDPEDAMAEPISFGAQLRRARIAAGLSLTGLAESVHYSKGYLSQIESGRRPPPPELARLCDAVLGSGGALAALAPLSVKRTHDGHTPAGPGHNAPLDGLDEDGRIMAALGDWALWSRPVERRVALAAGAASVFRYGSTSATADSASDGLECAPLEVFHEQFAQMRRLGQVAAPSLVLPILAAHMTALRVLSARVERRLRVKALVLAARFAEYTGWMAQEAGDDRAALWWTERASDLAAEAGENELVGYALVRRALVMLYRDDGVQTVELARRAQADSLSPRIRGLAAQREAQGHALIGDYDSFRKCIDKARSHFSRDVADTDTPLVGPTHLADPPSMISGWCLHDLGRPRTAAEILDRESARLPVHAARSRARYGVRRALAHAAAGEVDHACALTAELLDAVIAVESATIAIDMRRLARALGRFRTRPAVQEILPRLTAAASSSH